MPSINIMVLKYNINTTMEKKLKQFLTCNHDYTDLRSELIVSQISIFFMLQQFFIVPSEKTCFGICPLLKKPGLDIENGKLSSCFKYFVPVKA